MTENEAIRDLQYLIEEYSAYPPETGVNATVGSLQYCITALKEIQQYREIGTVEECREAVEKQEAKNIIRIAGRYPYKCPTCNGKLEIGYKHCIVCGQLLRYPYKNLEEQAYFVINADADFLSQMLNLSGL